MLPWGAAEARELGVHQPLIDGCAHETRRWMEPGGNRDLVETTSSRLGCLNFYHPEMQQQLLDLAVAAGAELLRPAEVTGVIPGNPPTFTLRANGVDQRVTARLVVGADERNSRVRGWAGFPVGRDPDGVTVAGILYRDLALPEDAVQLVLNPGVQRLSIIFPIGNRRFRAYVAFRHGAHAPLSGTKDQDRFIELSVATGAPAEWFGGASEIGPLASFDAPDNWAVHPYREGIVLIGMPQRRATRALAAASRSRCAMSACCAIASAKREVTPRRRTPMPRSTTSITAACTGSTAGSATYGLARVPMPRRCVPAHSLESPRIRPVWRILSPWAPKRRATSPRGDGCSARISARPIGDPHAASRHFWINERISAAAFGILVPGP